MEAGNDKSFSNKGTAYKVGVGNVEVDARTGVSIINQKEISGEVCKEINNVMKDIDVLEGARAGVLEGASAGVLEGASAGVFKGASAGVLEGASAGVLEGASAGVLEGGSAGVLEGANAGVSEGASAGVLEVSSAVGSKTVEEEVVNGLGDLLSSLSVSSGERLFSVDDIIHLPEFSTAQDKTEFIMKHLCVSNALIMEAEELSRGQRENPYWVSLRKGRLTGSNFGKVIKAIHRGKYPPSLFKSLLGEYGDISRVPAVRWGQQNESNAIQCYERREGVKVKECGMFLHPAGCLGISPDGIIDGKVLVEVKCPYSKRGMSIEDAAADKKFYLWQGDKKGEYFLDEDHDYYHQIQGQLYVTGLQTCQFIVWNSDTHFCSVTIPRDPAWAPNINLLMTFYREQLLPRILQQAGVTL